MRSYEIMFIVRPNKEVTELKNIVTEFETILKDNKVKVVKNQDMGQKELAYTIETHKTGYYYLYNIEASVEAIKEIDRLMRINENIIRYIILKDE